MTRTRTRTMIYCSIWNLLSENKPSLIIFPLCLISLMHLLKCQSLKSNHSLCIKGEMCSLCTFTFTCQGRSLGHIDVTTFARRWGRFRKPSLAYTYNCLRKYLSESQQSYLSPTSRVCSEQWTSSFF